MIYGSRNLPKSVIQNSGNTTRILVIDEQPIYRFGLEKLLHDAGNLEICGFETSIEDLDSSLEPPDIIVLDIVIDKSNGIGGIKELIKRYPKTSVLVASSHDERIFAERCLRAGAKGYLMKTAPIGEHLEAFKFLSDGKLYLSPEMKRDLLNRMNGHEAKNSHSLLDRLSNRELLIVQHIGDSRDNSEIARDMKISVKTIESHRSRIKSKLELSSASELVRIATKLKHRKL